MAKAKTTIKKITQNAWECTKIFKTGEIEKRIVKDPIDIWSIGNTGVRNPWRIPGGYKVYVESNQEGKILHWGLSEMSEEYLRRAHAVCPVTAIQNRYSMMARWHEKLFPVLEELNIGFVAFSPLANGFLSGKYNAQSVFEKNTDYRSIMPQFQKDSYEKNQEFLAWIQEFAEEKNATVAQISLAWMVDKKQYLVPIPGTRKLERLEENAGASDILLTPEEVKKIDAMLEKIPMSEVFGGTKVTK